jgi:hypothetical protein
MSALGMQWQREGAPAFGPLTQGSSVASRLGFINNAGLRGNETWWTSAIFGNGRSDISGSRVQNPTVKWQPGLRPWVTNFCNAQQALQHQDTPRRATASTGNPSMTTSRSSLLSGAHPTRADVRDRPDAPCVSRIRPSTSVFASRNLQKPQGL